MHLQGGVLMSNGRISMEGGIIPLARQRVNRIDEEEERRLRLQRVDPNSPMYDPGLPTMYARPSRLSRLGQQIKATPQRIRDFTTGAFYGVVPWTHKAEEALYPGQQYTPEEIQEIERYAASQLPRTPSGEVTPAGQVGVFAGALAPEFTLAGDAQALTRVPGHIRAGEWGSAGLEALGILGIGGALARARRPLEGLDNMQRSRLITAISNAGQGKGDVNFWKGRINKGFKGEGVAQAEVDYIGIMDLLDSDPSRKWTQDELLEYLNNNRFRLKEQIKEGGGFRNITMKGDGNAKPKNYRQISLIIEPGSPEVRAGHKKIDDLQADFDAQVLLHKPAREAHERVRYHVIDLYDMPLEELAAMLSKERLPTFLSQYGIVPTKTIKINGVDIDTALAQRVLKRRRRLEPDRASYFIKDPEYINAQKAEDVLRNDELVLKERIESEIEALDLPPIEDVARSSHGMGKGAVGHIRTTDRRYMNPTSGVRERVLFVEELQSDWAGRARGENEPLEEYRRTRNPGGSGFKPTVRQQEAISEELDDAWSQIDQSKDSLSESLGSRSVVDLITDSNGNVVSRFTVGETVLDDIVIKGLNSVEDTPVLRELVNRTYLRPGQVLFRAGHRLTSEDVKLLNDITTGDLFSDDIRKIFDPNKVLAAVRIRRYGNTPTSNTSLITVADPQASPEQISDYLKKREQLLEVRSRHNKATTLKPTRQLDIGDLLRSKGTGGPLDLIDPKTGKRFEIPGDMIEPANPYGQTEDYVELMVRRAIQLAVDEGKHRVTFPTGRQSITTQKTPSGTAENLEVIDPENPTNVALGDPAYPTHARYYYDPETGQGHLIMDHSLDLDKPATDNAIGHQNVTPDELVFYLGLDNAAELLSDGSREGIAAMKKSLREMIKVRDELETLNATQMNPVSIRNKIVDEVHVQNESQADWLRPPDKDIDSRHEYGEYIHDGSGLGENWKVVDYELATGEPSEGVKQLFVRYMDPDTRHIGNEIGEPYDTINGVNEIKVSRKKISSDILGDVLMEDIVDTSTNKVIYRAGDTIDEAMLARLEDHAMRSPTGSAGMMTPTVSMLEPQYSKSTPYILSIHPDFLMDATKPGILEHRSAFLKRQKAQGVASDHNAFRETLPGGQGNWQARHFTTSGVTGTDLESLHKGYWYGSPTFNNVKDTERYNELIEKYQEILSNFDDDFIRSIPDEVDERFYFADPESNEVVDLFTGEVMDGVPPPPMVLHKERGITDLLDRGMESFYDNEIPKAINNVLRKLLGKSKAKKVVEKISIPGIRPRVTHKAGQVEGDQLSIILSPELIQAVKEKGFFLRATGGLITLKGLKEKKEKDRKKYMYGGIVKLGIERMANG
jgi:hypothetical protein